MLFGPCVFSGEKARFFFCFFRFSFVTKDSVVCFSALRASTHGEFKTDASDNPGRYAGSMCPFPTSFTCFTPYTMGYLSDCVCITHVFEGLLTSPTCQITCKESGTWGLRRGIVSSPIHGRHVSIRIRGYMRVGERASSVEVELSFRTERKDTAGNRKRL